MKKLINNPYSYIRGFNYCPSYMSVLNDVMDCFDADIIRKELAGAQKLGANSIRVWVSHVSWLRDPEKFLADFDTLLSIADSYGLVVMPALFNRWTDPDYPIGQLDLTNVLSPMSEVNKNYVRSFAGHFARDPRILMWDLCNEPFFYSFRLSEESVLEIKRKERAYWMECVQLMREIAPSQPLTIGFMGGVDPELEELYQALDVISFHPYSEYWCEGYGNFVDGFIEEMNRLNKPLICTETCQGSLNDRTRAEIVVQTLTALRDREIGWMAWHLCESRIVTGNRERTDGNCRPGEQGYMPFILADGSIRPGHEVVLEFTKSK